MTGASNPCGKRQPAASDCAGVLVGLMAAVCGCAGTQPEDSLAFAPPPPSVEAPPPLVSVAIIPAGDQPAFVSARIVEGAGGRAKSGAGKGAVYGALPGMYMAGSGDPIVAIGGLMLGLPGAVIGSVVGAVAGAVDDEPAADVKAAEATLRQTVLAIDVSEQLADLIANTADAAGLSVRTGKAVRDTPADALAAEGFETALRVSVPIVGVSYEGRVGVTGTDPLVDVVMCVNGEVVTTADERTLWSHAWAYRSHALPFFALADKKGQPLREEIDAGLVQLASMIVANVFPGAAPRGGAEMDTPTLEVRDVGENQPSVELRVKDVSPEDSRSEVHSVASCILPPSIPAQH
jgi:hypothetical protein